MREEDVVTETLSVTKPVAAEDSDETFGVPKDKGGETLTEKAMRQSAASTALGGKRGMFTEDVKEAAMSDDNKVIDAMQKGMNLAQKNKEPDTNARGGAKSFDDVTKFNS